MWEGGRGARLFAKSVVAFPACLWLCAVLWRCHVWFLCIDRLLLLLRCGMLVPAVLCLGVVGVVHHRSVVCCVVVGDGVDVHGAGGVPCPCGGGGSATTAGGARTRPGRLPTKGKDFPPSTAAAAVAASPTFLLRPPYCGRGEVGSPAHRLCWTQCHACTLPPQANCMRVGACWYTRQVEQSSCMLGGCSGGGGALPSCPS